MIFESDPISIRQRAGSILLPLRSLNPRILVRIQPAGKVRFRYASEHPSYLRGAGSTRDNETFPTVEILDYHGHAELVVYSVTDHPTPRLHPYKLQGTCCVSIDPSSSPMSHSFKDLNIQCITRRTLRELHGSDLDDVNVNVIRLCFEVTLLTDSGQVMQTLTAFSTKIYNEKKRPNLSIHRLSDSSGPAKGGKKIILLCEEIDKNDIQVRFTHYDSHQSETWCDYGKFHAESDVHKKVAICFDTPPFHDPVITESVMVRIRLERPSDGSMSEEVDFEYFPSDFELKRKRLSQLKRSAESRSRPLPPFEEIRNWQTSPSRNEVESFQLPTTSGANSNTDDGNLFQYTLYNNFDWFDH